jgi:hypothetical protein
MSKHIGSSFDDFLEEEGVLAEAEAIAVKRVIAFQLEKLMKEQKLTKAVPRWSGCLIQIIPL